ncbi:MAG: hypothetical protein ACKV2V_30650 [Blastocatellia bacterium]
MEITLTTTISDEVAAHLQNGSTTPLPRRLLELAIIRAHEADFITEHEVREILGFEDREELWELFKRYDVRSKHTSGDFAQSRAALATLLSQPDK